MSKGNMLLGYARGKVGSLVFSRNNNEQIVRARNYHPKNPRTNAQLYQRAIMATVMRAYSAGKDIFDHSFQGKSVGDMNMRRFLSVNTRALRALLASEVNTNSLVRNARVVAPKSQFMVPFQGLIMSEGNYPQNAIAEKNSGEFSLEYVGNNPNIDIEEIINKNGLIPGDIYTFVLCSINRRKPVFSVEGYVSQMATQYESQFGYLRLQVKDLYFESGTTIGDVKWGDIFEITAAVNVNEPNLGNIAAGETFSLARLVPTDYSVGGYGWIRSRLDKDLRSTSVMKIEPLTTFGITARYALPAWKQGTEELGESELILENGTRAYTESKIIGFEQVKNTNSESADFGKYFVVANTSDGGRVIVIDDSTKGIENSGAALYNFSKSNTSIVQDEQMLYKTTTLIKYETGTYNTALEMFNAALKVDGQKEWFNANRITNFIFVQDAINDVAVNTGIQYTIGA